MKEDLDLNQPQAGTGIVIDPDVPLQPIDPGIPIVGGYSISFKSNQPTIIPLHSSQTYYVGLSKVESQIAIITKLPDSFYIRGYVDTADIWVATSSLREVTILDRFFPITFPDYLSLGNHELIVRLEEDRVIKKGDVIEIVTVTHATATLDIQVSRKNTNYLYSDSSSTQDLTTLLTSNKNLLVNYAWPHTIEKHFKNHYEGFSNIGDYAIYTGTVDEPESWDLHSCKLPYYIQSNGKMVELHVIDKRDVSSYEHCINDQLNIEDPHYSDYGLHSLPSYRQGIECYWKITRTDEELTLRAYNISNDLPLIDPIVKRKDEFEYGFVPEVIYVAACGGGAAGLCLREYYQYSDYSAGRTPFIHNHFNCCTSEKTGTYHYLASGGGSGASLLFGLQFIAGQESFFYMKAGLGGLQYARGSTGSSGKLNTSENGQSTIISLTLTGIKNPKSANNDEVLVLEGGKQIEFDNRANCKIYNSNSYAGFYKNMLFATAIFYKKEGNVYKKYTYDEESADESLDPYVFDYTPLWTGMNKSSRFIAVRPYLDASLGIRESHFISGKKCIIGSIGFDGQNYNWTQRYISFLPYVGVGAVWGDCSDYQYKDSEGINRTYHGQNNIDWYRISSEAPSYYWNLTRDKLSIPGIYKSNPDIIKTAYSSGAYFYEASGSNQICHVGGASSLFGEGVLDVFLDTQGWPARNGTAIAPDKVYRTNATGFSKKPSSLENHRTGYGAGGSASSSTSRMTDQWDANVWQDGGPGCIFLYY